MRVFLLTVILCLFIKHAASQVLLNNRQTYTLDGNIFIYNEEKGSLDPYDAFQLYRSGKFHSISTTGNNINTGLSKFVCWIAIPLHFPSGILIPTEIGIANAGVYKLEFYHFSKEGKLLLSYGPTGKNYDFYSRLIINRHYYFPVSYLPDSSSTIFFRVDMRGNDFYTPINLYSSSYRIKTEQNRYLFYFFFSGFLAFIALFSFGIFIFTKQRLYLFYCLYVSNWCLMFMADGDLDFEWLYPHWPVWASIAPSMYGTFVVLFMLFFTQDFLQLNSTHPKLARLARTLQFLLLIMIVLIPSGYSFLHNTNFRILIYYYGSITIISSWLFQAYCIIRRILNKFSPAYIYGIAIVPVFIASTYYILHSFNVLTYTHYTSNFLLFGFTTEILILAFALVYNYNFFRVQNKLLAESLISQQLHFGDQLINLQEAERKRIAEDLHDELGSSLAALKLRLQKTALPDEVMNDILKVVDKATDDTRNISHNLMPPEFEKTSLNSLLSNYYAKLNAESGIHFYFHTSGSNQHFIKEDELIIYRIIMELTQNILKHSEATEATLQLIYYANQLEIMTEDNGRGIPSNHNDGIGLKNIQSRVNYLNGELKIDSGPIGTTVMIQVPYKPK